MIKRTRTARRKAADAQPELQLTEGGELPVPDNLDLRHFNKFPIDMRRLRTSKMLLTTTGECFRVAFMAWMGAWHEVPAGSLPDDEVHLAAICGFGRDVDGFRAIRSTALYGFVKLKDGRLYHPVVCEMALAAMPFSAKQRNAIHSRWKHKVKLKQPNSANTSGVEIEEKKDSSVLFGNNTEARVDGTDGIRTPEVESSSNPLPTDCQPPPNRVPTEKPPRIIQGALWAEPAPETRPGAPTPSAASAGEAGEGTADLGAVHPTDADGYRKAVWAVGLVWLGQSARVDDRKARQLIGQWLKLAGRREGGQDFRRIFQLMRSAQAEGVVEPVGWIYAALRGRPAEPRGRPRTAVPDGGLAAQVLAESRPSAFQTAVRAWREGGMVGPPPKVQDAHP